MISISRISSKSLLYVLAIWCISALLIPHALLAQQSLALSVTPTLFEMSANPGQLWQSSVKVINSNSFDITVYARVVNFAPQGESGQGKLLPVFEKVTEGATLAEWIDITNESITIGREESETISFTVNVPKDASPGGHFAAILVSTQPPETDESELSIKTTQIVTSLFFVRVAGDVNESGSIRSFLTSGRFVQIPKTNFELRFENKGNVHLQPRGSITIYNMWGKERGYIPINHQTHFGNVLPDSIRNFEFSWVGERSFSDFGRYRAVASLSYGSDAKQSATSTAYFWVIPVKPLLITLGSLIAFGFFISWLIKLYVRRMLQLAGVSVDTRERMTGRREVEKGDIAIAKRSDVSAPLRSGLSDLHSRLAGNKALLGIIRAFSSFVISYKFFFIGLIGVCIGIGALIYFISDATESGRSYDVTIENPGVSTHLNAEEVAYQRIADRQNLPAIGVETEQRYTIDIVNTSDVAGTAAEAAATVTQLGYVIRSISFDESRVDKSSVVVFDSSVQEEALHIGRLIGGALPSSRSATGTEGLPNITLYVGTDNVKE